MILLQAEPIKVERFSVEAKLSPRAHNSFLDPFVANSASLVNPVVCLDTQGSYGKEKDEKERSEDNYIPERENETSNGMGSGGLLGLGSFV